MIENKNKTKQNRIIYIFLRVQMWLMNFNATNYWMVYYAGINKEEDKKYFD